jgi:hypothetical protein
VGGLFEGELAWYSFFEDPDQPVGDGRSLSSAGGVEVGLDSFTIGGVALFESQLQLPDGCGVSECCLAVFVGAPDHGEVAVFWGAEASAQTVGEGVEVGAEVAVATHCATDDGPEVFQAADALAVEHVYLGHERTLPADSGCLLNVSGVHESGGSRVSSEGVLNVYMGRGSR